MEPAFVTVLVEEHEALPDGCCMRFKRIGEPQAVRRVMYEPETGDCVGGDGGRLERGGEYVGLWRRVGAEAARG
jgi:hypothetical protein